MVKKISRVKKARLRTAKNRKTLPKNVVITLYGKLVQRGKVVAYCDLHKCYLMPIDIKTKKCNHCNNGHVCRHLKQLDRSGITSIGK